MFRFGQYPTQNALTLHQSQTIASVRNSNRRSKLVTAVSNGPSGSGGNQSNRFNPVWDRLEEGSVVEDWIPRDLPGLNKMFEQLLIRDGVLGPGVDIYSNSPWSSFDIVKVNDPKIRQFYEEAFSLFDPMVVMPKICRDYLGLGRFICSLIYNESKGYWDDFMPHDSSFCTITPISIGRTDPKIDLLLGPGVRQLMSSNDWRDKLALKRLPQSLLQKMRSGKKIELDPLNTMFVARRVSLNDNVGTSLLTRALPFWALEKALVNATVTAARRRAGNILHVSIGLDDRWEPTQPEMEDIANLFVQADEDPIGAVVATRTGVTPQEIRQGGQIWKMSDEWAFLTEAKMRSIGVSDAFLSGDASYSNMKESRSVFVEQMRQTRLFLTSDVYIKRAEILARAHGFVKRTEAELSHRVRITKTQPTNTEEPVTDKQLKKDDLGLTDVKKNIEQSRALDIPRDQLILPAVHWHKSMLPESDSQYLDILKTLKEEGVPIPLRSWAARGGFDIDEAVESLDDDIKLRTTIEVWRKAVQPKEEGEAGGAGADTDSFENNGVLPLWNTQSSFVGVTKDDFAKTLKHFATPAKNRVLASVNDSMKEIASVFDGNTHKTEVAAYLLARVGLLANVDISEKTIGEIAEFIHTQSVAKESTKIRELLFLNKTTSKTMGNLDTKGLDTAVQRLSKSTMLKAEAAVPNTAPTMVAGAGNFVDKNAEA